MKVALINPKKLGYDLIENSVSMGICYIASYVKNKGYTWDIFDFSQSIMSNEQLIYWTYEQL